MNANIHTSLQQDFTLWLKKNILYIKDPDENLLRQSFTYACSVYRSEKRRNGEYTLETILKILEALTFTPADSLTYALAMFTKTDPLITQDPNIATLHEDLPELLNNYYQLSRLKIELDDTRISDSLAKIFFVIADNPRVTLTRLADRLVNLQTSEAFDEKQQKIMATKSLKLYSPLAQILGLKHIYAELENEAFKLLHPEIHEAIAQAVKQIEQKYTPKLVETVQLITDILTEQGAEHYVSVRIKKPYSVYNKMRFKFPDTSPDDTDKLISILFDIVGIRVIVPGVADCYTFVSAFQQHTDHPIAIKDYIQQPKPNNYQSIHCYHPLDETVKIEIQVRTFEMHERNEFGDASHFYYKVVDPYSRKVNSDNWIKNIVTWQENIQGASIEAIGYFQKNIYTLTPKRKVIQLPQGATVLDFAYAVHQGIGDAALQAYVNDKLVPLDHQLQNGDVVFIKTGKRVAPPFKFISTVKTSKAKKALSQFKHGRT